MSEEKLIELANALKELKAIYAEDMANRVAECSTELIRIQERFNRQMAVIEAVRWIAFGLAVAALVWVIALEVKKHAGLHE